MKVKFLLLIPFFVGLCHFQSHAQQTPDYNFIANNWIALDPNARWDDSLKLTELRLTNSGKKVKPDEWAFGVIHFEIEKGVVTTYGEVAYKINGKRIFIGINQLYFKRPQFWEREIPYIYDKATGILTLTIGTKKFKFKKEPAVVKKK
jgi:hypothetical protein